MPNPERQVVVPVPTELRATREEWMHRVATDEIPSLAIGVLCDGKTIWEEAIGWADREQRRPATPQTLYPIASVSKAITATGVGALAGDGRLPLSRRLGDVLESADMDTGLCDVTVEHLLGHTSGVPHLWHYEYLDREETMADRECLIAEHAFVAFAPGAHLLYSNLAYGCLAQVIEQVVGKPFQRAMETTVLQPLGMDATTVEAWVGGNEGARGYDEDGCPIAYPYRLASDGGAGFFSNVNDLLRFSRFHLGVDVGDASLGHAAINRIPDVRGSEAFYVNGWGIVRLAGSSVLLSDGQIAGGTAIVVLIPERGLGVVALCNATGGPAAEAAVGVLAALERGFGEEFTAAVESIEARLSELPEAPKGSLQGVVEDGPERIEVAADFRDSERPLIRVGQSEHSLRAICGDRGAYQATIEGSLFADRGKERPHRLLLSLWPDGDSWVGVVQEDLFADRPLSGIPHRITLYPAT